MASSAEQILRDLGVEEDRPKPDSPYRNAYAVVPTHVWHFDGLEVAYWDGNAYPALPPGPDHTIESRARADADQRLHVALPDGGWAYSPRVPDLQAARLLVAVLCVRLGDREGEVRQLLDGFLGIEVVA